MKYYNRETNCDPLQALLFKAAKLGDTKLMSDFIMEGANPFALDEKAVTPFMYAMRLEPKKTAALMLELKDNIKFKNEGIL